MKKVALGIAAVAALIGTPAMAADMAVKAPPPPPAPVFSWTGFYVGGDIGGAWTSTSATRNFLPSPAVSGFSPFTGTETGSGVIGSVHAGYNYQFGTNAVIGVEADWSGVSATKGSVAGPWIVFVNGTVSPGTLTTMSTKLDWLTSVRGRLGYLVTPTVLAYATGGVAWADFSYAALSENAFGTYLAATAFDKTQAGFVVGGGIEWALIGNWLVRAEYLFYGFGNNPSVLATSANFPPFPSNFIWNKNDVSVARAGLTYKF